MIVESETKTDNSDTILETAKKRFQLAVEAELEIRPEALDDLKFSSGDQWPDKIKKDREVDRRPCLTINRLPQSIHQLTNDQRQNRPSIKVSGVDDKADPKTAEVLQGMIRHIEYSSDADTAYDTAFDSAVRVGFGYFRIVTEYCDAMSFEQEIRIKRIRNRFSVYLDPSYQNPDGSDANWGFVFEDIPHDEYKAQYPNSELASMDDWDSIGDTKANWASAHTYRVAEYFYKEFKDTKIVQLSDKTVFTEEELKNITEKLGGLPPDVKVVSERQTQVPVIKWCKLNGKEILEQTDWPGKWIPIIPVLGEELDIDGKRVLSGIVRGAKDSQRMYNYWASVQTETIALAPRAPFIGVEGQFEGHEAKWESANVRNHAFLEYRQIAINGQPAPAPQRNVYEPPVQAITQARGMAAEDIKSTTGIYDAALGNRSNEQSGVAIQRRANQAQTSNFHFIDNLSKSIRHAGRICVDLAPKIYDTPRAARILGEDGKEEIIRINELFERKGEAVKYDLGAGKYDVTVNTGPSFETKRQEASQTMLELTKVTPVIGQVAADLLVRSMDFHMAPEIADRIKKTLPPGIADDADKKQPVDPKMQAQMEQMGQMIEQLTEQLHASQDKLDNKTIELESKERIEFAKLETQATIELAKLESKEALNMLANQIAEIDARTKMLGIGEPFPTNEPEMNGAGPEGAAMPSEQPQPTGGLPPGEFIGE